MRTNNLYIILTFSLLLIACNKKVITYYDEEKVKVKSIVRLNKHEELNGKLVVYYRNGQKKSECNYKNGNECNGYDIAWFENGLLEYKGYYNNNCESDGNYTKWFSNGKIKEIHYYNNGKFDSIWHYFDSTGNVLRKEIWKNGILKDSITFR